MKNKTIYLTIRVDVVVPEDYTNELIVQEFDYNFSSDDEKVSVKDCEIYDVYD